MLKQSVHDGIRVSVWKVKALLFIPSSGKHYEYEGYHFTMILVAPLTSFYSLLRHVRVIVPF